MISFVLLMSFFTSCLVLYVYPSIDFHRFMFSSDMDKTFRDPTLLEPLPPLFYSALTPPPRHATRSVGSYLSSFLSHVWFFNSFLRNLFLLCTCQFKKMEKRNTPTNLRKWNFKIIKCFSLIKRKRNTLKISG